MHPPNALPHERPGWRSGRPAELTDWRTDDDDHIQDRTGHIEGVERTGSRGNTAPVGGRADARSGDRIAIASYLGNSDRFDRAILEFAKAYAEQNARDYNALADAVKSGRVTAQTRL